MRCKKKHVPKCQRGDGIYYMVGKQKLLGFWQETISNIFQVKFGSFIICVMNHLQAVDGSEQHCKMHR